MYFLAIERQPFDPNDFKVGHRIPRCQGQHLDHKFLLIIKISNLFQNILTDMKSRKSGHICLCKIQQGRTRNTILFFRPQLFIYTVTPLHTFLLLFYKVVYRQVIYLPTDEIIWAFNVFLEIQVCSDVCDIEVTIFLYFLFH